MIFDEGPQPTQKPGPQGAADLDLRDEMRSSSPKWNPSNATYRIQKPDAVTTQLHSPDSLRPREVPPEPPDNPWLIEQPPISYPNMNDIALEDDVVRRRRVSSIEDTIEARSPVALLPVASRSDLRQLQPEGLEEVTGDGSEHRGHAMQYSSTDSPIGPCSANFARLGNHVTPEAGTDGPSSPSYNTSSEKERSSVVVPVENKQRLERATPGVPVMSSRRQSHASTASSGHPSLFEPGTRDSAASLAHSPPNISPFPFQPVFRDHPDDIDDWPLTGPQGVLSTPSGASNDQPGLEAVHMSGEEGLIPVTGEAFSQPNPSVTQTKETDVTINIDSSFYQHRGFCDGAKDVIRGRAGVKKIKKPVSPVCFQGYGGRVSESTGDVPLTPRIGHRRRNHRCCQM